VRRTLRHLRHATWTALERVTRWATAPRHRGARVLRVALATWIAAYAVMSVVDFVRVGSPTRWVLLVPTALAALLAALTATAAWHPAAPLAPRVVAARRVHARVVLGEPAPLAGLPGAVDRHRVASANAPRRLRAAQRDEVARLVTEVNGHVVAAHAVDLVTVDPDDGTVRAVPGAESSYADLVAVAAHRVRCIDELSAQALAASLDERVAVAGHLDQIAVAARLAAQRELDTTLDPTVSDPLPAAPAPPTRDDPRPRRTARRADADAGPS
jgi:hypothetical protein